MDNKTLIDSVSRRTDLSKKDVTSLLEAMSSVIAERGRALDAVAIPGFGSFEPRKREERVMMMPSTGKRMLLPPKISLTFKPSAILKQKLRETPLQR